jgi:glycosyltransferase involved in cell wall biosynthesis
MQEANMKICIDISPLSVTKKTGIGKYAENLIKKTLEIGVQHEFYLFGFCPLNSISNMQNISFKSYPNVRKIKIIPLPSKFSVTSYLAWQFFDFPSIESLIGADVEIYHNFEWYFPPIKKIKSVATVYDLTTLIYPDFHKKNNIKLQNMRLKRLSKATQVIAISQSTKRDLIRYFPELANKIEIIYPGCSSNFYVKTTNETAATLAKYKLKDDFILTVGTQEPRKNITRLIKAFLSSSIVQDKLVVVGQKGWGSLEEISDPRIIFLDYIPDNELNDLYNACHFFAYISLYEGFGIPVLEAMRLGKRVLVSDTSSLPEVVSSFGNLVNPTSINEIRKGLESLSESSNSYETNQKVIEQSNIFSYEQSAIKLLNIYENL